MLAEDTETNGDKLDTEPGETADLTEQQRVGDFTDFMPLWCTTDASGVLMCPAGISLEMISEQHFTETQRLTGGIAEISEELGTFEGAVDTEPVETVITREESEITEGAIDTEPEEIAELNRWQAEVPESEPTPDDRIAELEAQNQVLTECLMEMSQIVYA